MKNISKLFYILVAFVLCVGFSVSTVKAAEKNIDVSNLKLTYTDGKEYGDSIHYNYNFGIKFDWSATKYGTELSNGDTFTIKLPDEMKFPSNSSARFFDMKDANGNVVAKAVVNPNSNGGGTLVGTFTDYVDTHNNIKGNAFLQASFVQSKLKMNEVNKFKISSSNTSSTSIKVIGVTESKDVINKWSEKAVEGNGEINEEIATWFVRINPSSANLTNVTVTDTLDSSVEFDSNSFRLTERTFNSNGHIESTGRTIRYAELISSGKLKVNGNTFTLTLGNLDCKGYDLAYNSTYNGKRITNTAKLVSNERTQTSTGAFALATSGGSAEGNNNSKIIVHKVDSETNKPISGVEFEVESSTGKKHTITTDSNGLAKTEKLVSGNYKVKEIKAKKGYILDGTVHEVKVESDSPTELTVKNKKEKISLKIDKEWIDTYQDLRPDSIEVVILNGDKEVKKVNILKEENWTKTVELDKYDEDGNEITYDLLEMDAQHYYVTIERTEDGFKIINDSKDKYKTDKEEESNNEEDIVEVIPNETENKEPKKTNKTKESKPNKKKAVKKANTKKVSNAPKTGDNTFMRIEYLIVGFVSSLAILKVIMWISSDKKEKK